MPYAPSGTPAAIALPSVKKSGSSPHNPLSPAYAQTSECVSSIARSVSVSRVSRRMASWNPGSGRMNPTFVIAGSVSTSATSPGARARSKAATSLNPITRVRPAIPLGKPSYSGTTSPSSSTTSVVSSRPWYFPSNSRTMSRPVAWRASRITSVFAWVAESVNCHFGSP